MSCHCLVGMSASYSQDRSHSWLERCYNPSFQNTIHCGPVVNIMIHMKEAPGSYHSPKREVAQTNSFCGLPQSVHTFPGMVSPIRTQVLLSTFFLTNYSLTFIPQYIIQSKLLTMSLNNTINRKM